METKVLTMHSQTAAMKAKRSLEKKDIYVQIVRPSPKITPKGCSFGLQMDARLVSTVLYYLEKEEIPYGEILEKYF